jgi:hypothetical protein
MKRKIMIIAAIVLFFLGLYLYEMYKFARGVKVDTKKRIEFLRTKKNQNDTIFVNQNDTI